MFVIGELINGMYQNIGKAIKEHDKAVIQNAPSDKFRQAPMPWM